MFVFFLLCVCVHTHLPVPEAGRCPPAAPPPHSRSPPAWCCAAWPQAPPGYGLPCLFHLPIYTYRYTCIHIYTHMHTHICVYVMMLLVLHLFFLLDTPSEMVSEISASTGTTLHDIIHNTVQSSAVQPTRGGRAGGVAAELNFLLLMAAGILFHQYAGICLTSRMRSPGCRRPSLTAAPRGRMFFTRIGPGPWTEESRVTTVKPRPSAPVRKNTPASRHVHLGVSVSS